MKRYFLLCVATLMLVATFIGSSCKKIIHSNAPVPNNVRMLSYNKITTIRLTVPVAGLPSTITESFRFYYDNINRLKRIIYTGNDSFEIHKRIDFTYASDTVYKHIYNVLTSTMVEIDTFIMNSNGMIVTAMTPNMVNTFEYYGQLLARNIRTASSWRNITMTDNSTYTSVNGDFLKHNFDGVLKLQFNDLTTPLDFVWVQSATNSDVISATNSLSYTRTGYNYTPVYVHVLDATGKQDSLHYPGLFWVNEGYHFYTEDANRVGDYLQLESFTMYGNNIYRNSHLVESITARNRNAAIKYDIDAYSKITRCTATIVDSVLNNFTTVYDIQYETY